MLYETRQASPSLLTLNAIYQFIMTTNPKENTTKEVRKSEP